MELLTNNGAGALPYLIVVVLCLFWLLGSGMQRREPGDGKKSDGHASWRVSEVASPLRRIWHVTRKRTGR
jgi:hypothetical protein